MGDEKMTDNEKTGKINEVLDRYRGLTAQSQELFRRAERVMPGGISHSFRYHWPYPVYAVRAKGSRFWDVDPYLFWDPSILCPWDITDCLFRT